MVILIKRLQTFALLFFTEAVQIITTYVLKYIHNFTSMYRLRKSYKLSVLLKVNRDGWMDGWMNGWMDGWMDEWMDE